MFRLACGLAVAPPRVAHEAVHYLLSAPFAERLSVRVSASAFDATTAADWKDDAPRWGVVLAHLGPLLCGLVLGVAAVAWFVLEGSVPESALGWFQVSVLAVWWAVFTAPSGGDLAVLFGGGPCD